MTSESHSVTQTRPFRHICKFNSQDAVSPPFPFPFSLKTHHHHLRRRRRRRCYRNMEPGQVAALALEDKRLDVSPVTWLVCDLELSLIEGLYQNATAVTMRWSEQMKYRLRNWSRMCDRKQSRPPATGFLETSETGYKNELLGYIV